MVENLVVGAGLAGLSCAAKLHGAGREVLVIESSDSAGGRVKTDQVDGFLLDRGFQVYLDAYPVARNFLDLDALDLRPFEPGALVWKNGILRAVMDVFRRPLKSFNTALSPIGSIRDKLLVAKLRSLVRGKSCDEIWESKEHTTEFYLRDFGFSPTFIDEFFRSFYGGIFLENELKTSSRLFEFTFKMFSSGSATLPSDGMQAIPRQIASRIPKNAIRFNCPAMSINGTTVDTENRLIKAENVIIATDATSAARLTGNVAELSWNSTVCIYFSANTAPIREPILTLKGDRTGLVNHVCVPSTVASSYAPRGKSLISVSVIGDPKIPWIENAVREELADWFGQDVISWTHLRTDVIREALPTTSLGHSIESATVETSLHVCGDYTTSASIEGAILSGLRVAERILA